MSDLLVPKVSMAMEDAVVSQWLVASGDYVSAGQEVVVIETDKSTVEVESPASGIITLIAKENDIVNVDGLLARIDDDTPSSPDDGDMQRPVKPAVPRDPADREQLPAPQPAEAPRPRASASPAARALAAQLRVNIDSLAGSGPSGRVVERDVREAAEAASPAPSLRKAVVANLTASWAQIPHINIGGRVPADPLKLADRQFKDDGSTRVTVSDLLITVVAKALRDVPELVGSSLDGARSDADGRVNLAVAIAAPGGVVAPVIADAQDLTILEIASQRRRLVEAALNGNLSSRDLAGANCTLSNLGGYPVDFFTPVITGPQICLVAVGRISPEVVFTDETVRLRERIWMNAAIDHRMADGEAGGRFLAAVATHIDELPSRARHELGMEST